MLLTPTAQERELLAAKSHLRGEEDEDGCISGFLYYYPGSLSTAYHLEL